MATVEKMTAEQLKTQLQQFTGTERHLYNPLYPKMRYTDGVKYFAEHAGGQGAYWLLDIIGTEFHKQVTDYFMIIEIKVHESKAVIEMRIDTDMPVVYSRDIDFTDLQEGTWKFYLIDDVLLLPSEY